ncbi:DUF5996 family protein [Brevundimonas sp. Root1423]|uniref:DUF5996 family protein n=1 Tax=Brevundimonas sp. Root1423 TaxID=1736462 RepID=UPI000700E7BB|nr:DUF5996 family protein [Brevundimonas sp. Root1423]KQY96494.1 hypothetical protein ASD25_01035 [Brevundimonas sp. Root1423]
MTSDAITQAWPDLSSPLLGPTAETLQLWTQIVGKVRLARTPWLNHSWHTTLHVSARGLATSLIPHDGVSFDLEFDLVVGELVIRVSDGGERRIELTSCSPADFHTGVMDALAGLGVATTIVARPNEMAEATPFPQDTRRRDYDADVARDYWRALVQVDQVLNRFRSRFLGKCSPVHLFWGGFDMAVTRFSGRPAPLHPGGIPHLPDDITREAYSHEVSSAGFWPGGGGVEGPCFYAYAYPTPEGFASAAVAPAQARFDPALGEFLLPYEAVRTAPDPDAALLSFLQTTYEAAADLAGWDRAALECEEGLPRRPRRV